MLRWLYRTSFGLIVLWGAEDVPLPMWARMGLLLFANAVEANRTMILPFFVWALGGIGEQDEGSEPDPGVAQVDEGSSVPRVGPSSHLGGDDVLGSVCHLP